MDELLGRLSELLLPGAESSGWNREVFHADGATPDAIVTAGLSLPLFAGRRLVLVRGLAEVPARTVERLRDAIAAARRGPGGWPAEGTTVVLVAAGVDRRAPALRLGGEAEPVEVRAPSGRAVVGWLRERARARGLELAPAAAQALVDLVGEDLGRLAAELDKAALYAPGERQVSEAVVRALAGETRSRQYWELTQALEDGRRAEALDVAARLLAAGDEPLVVLAWLVGYLRDLWRVLPAACTPGGSGAVRQAAQALLPRKRPDWAVERLMGRARALGQRGIAEALERCLEVDTRLKSGAGSPRALLTVLVADLAR